MTWLGIHDVVGTFHRKIDGNQAVCVAQLLQQVVGNTYHWITAVSYFSEQITPTYIAIECNDASRKPF